MALYKVKEWQGSSGLWYCGNVDDLAHNSGAWWLPARMMNLPPAKYLDMVIKTFKPDRVVHSDDCNFVSFSWLSQSQVRVYKNWLNAEARKRNFNI